VLGHLFRQVFRGPSASSRRAKRNAFQGVTRDPTQLVLTDSQPSKAVLASAAGVAERTGASS